MQKYIIIPLAFVALMGMYCSCTTSKFYCCLQPQPRGVYEDQHFYKELPETIVVILVQPVEEVLDGLCYDWRPGQDGLVGALHNNFAWYEARIVGYGSGTHKVLAHESAQLGTPLGATIEAVYLPEVGECLLPEGHDSSDGLKMIVAPWLPQVGGI